MGAGKTEIVNSVFGIIRRMEEISGCLENPSLKTLHRKRRSKRDRPGAGGQGAAGNDWRVSG